jgi:2-hydroxymuconate-semialdehyde hydrolase
MITSGRFFSRFPPALAKPLIPPGKAFVEIPAGRLAYVEAGQGEPILLIHGIPTSSFLWRNVIPHLARDFKVFAVDLLGFGDSDKPEHADLSIVGQVEHLRVFMDKVGWEKGSIAGHDIGGGIAQLMAVEHPELVTKLVLLDTIAYDSWPEPSIERLKDPGWDERMKELDLSKGFRKSLERGIFHKDRVDDELVSEYVRPFGDLQGRRAYLRCARALRTEDLLGRMKEVEEADVPTLIIWGEADDYQLVKYGERLRERMRKANLVVVKEAGHFIQEDQPDEVARLIRDFVKKNS